MWIPLEFVLGAEDLRSDKIPCQEQVWLLMLFHRERSRLFGEFLCLECGSCFLKCLPGGFRFCHYSVVFFHLPLQNIYTLVWDLTWGFLKCQLVPTLMTCYFLCSLNSKHLHFLSAFVQSSWLPTLAVTQCVCFIVEIHLRTSWAEWPVQCKHVWLIRLIWCRLAFNIWGWKIMSVRRGGKGARSSFLSSWRTVSKALRW